MSATLNLDKTVQIFFLSPYDPRASKRWSGTINSIFVAHQTRNPNIRFVSGGVFDWTGRAGRKFRSFEAADFAGSLRLLYVAVDWERKHGDLILEIACILRRAGWPCELFLIGRIPARVRPGNGIQVVGYLDKNDPADLTRVCELFESARLFIMPTTADASPIAFSEAQAFGCPSITCDVGGTSTTVLDNETGIVLPLTATAEDFARRIERLLCEPASYEAMSRNARRRYEQSANWTRGRKPLFNLLRPEDDRL